MKLRHRRVKLGAAPSRKWVGFPARVYLCVIGETCLGVSPTYISRVKHKVASKDAEAQVLNHCVLQACGTVLPFENGHMDISAVSQCLPLPFATMPENWIPPAHARFLNNPGGSHQGLDTGACGGSWVPSVVSLSASALSPFHWVYLGWLENPSRKRHFALSSATTPPPAPNRGSLSSGVPWAIWTKQFWVIFLKWYFSDFQFLL